MRRVVLAMCVSGCTASLPDVLPERFACTSDQPNANGDAQCPDSHWCSGEACVPRLECKDADGKPGCAPESDRCDLVSNGIIAAAACRRGTHTVTSTVPMDQAGACTCPDGTYCAILATTGAAASEALPLYLLPRGTAPASLPKGRLGITGDDPLDRVCVRACAGEADCPGNHTCRAAAVVQASLQSEPPSPAGTVGVCYPDRVVATSTTVVVPQPDPVHCESQSDCTSDQGRPDGPCQLAIVQVPDHPAVPAGAAAWGERKALVARCLSQSAGNLKPSGRGCTTSVECQSGVCLDRYCARLCDPRDLLSCDDIQRCRDFLVERELPGSTLKVSDRIYVCDRR